MSAGPTCIPPERGGGCLPIAPAKSRVDLTRPTFSNPTSITNPLHPSSKVAQVIYGGQVDGKPFRTEFTLLPDIRTITWNGQPTRTVTMQYFAYLDGCIEESRWTGSPRPTTAASGTSAKTCSTTTTGSSPTPTAPGWPTRRARRR
jgi:hypothetical protein